MNADDEKLIAEVKAEMLRRQELLTAANNGRSTWSSDPIPLDPVNPEFVFDKDTIRRETGRKIVRDVIMEEYADSFRKDGAFIVDSGNDNNFVVKTKPWSDRDNTFNSLAALRKANAESQDDT